MFCLFNIYTPLLVFILKFIFFSIFFQNSQVKLFGKFHQSVTKKSLQYLAELSRHNYVTPTSYLELLGMFKKVLGIKKNEIMAAKNRTKTGLDKVKYLSMYWVVYRGRPGRLKPRLMPTLDFNKRRIF